jgi:YD repeat-containing protein
MKRALIGLTAAVALAELAFIGNAAAASATRTSSFAYDANTGLVTQEVIEPNTAALRLEKDYVYDSFGNKVSVSVSGVDITTRSSTTTYDAKGQFVTRNTNALNQSETFAYDARFGAPTSHTGPNGLTTTWQYDSFGRKILEVRADGTQTKWQYSFCTPSSGCMPGATYYILAIHYASDGATQNAPAKLVHYDTLDRAIAQCTIGFDGSWVCAQTVYDTLGRVQKKSRPYFWSGGTPQWTTFAYDTLGRVTTETDPDSSTTQHAYHGLVTSDTNGLNQTRTVTRNSQGQVVSVKDALNNVTSYAYDPFGNATKTTDAVGNVVATTYDHAVTGISGGAFNTTFTYDGNGNQTAGLGRSIAYTSYNKPKSITQGSTTLFFSHDPDHARFKQNAPDGVTLYFDVFGAHVELVQAATSRWNEYLVAGGAMVGVRFENSDATVQTRYFTTDHLGSVAVITDENGNAV